MVEIFKFQQEKKKIKKKSWKNLGKKIIQPKAS
jgi:hypothetical protein